MQLHLFRGRDRIFGLTENIAGSNLPASYGPWTAIKSLDMSRSDHSPAVNTDECLNDIESYGFHITDAHVRITESALNTHPGSAR